MVRKCLVCKTPQVKDTPYSFHKFPKKDAVRSEWLKACSMEGEKIADIAVICSKHFKVDDFDEASWPTKRLLSSAVPCPSSIYKTERTAMAVIEDLPTKEPCTDASHTKPHTTLPINVHYDEGSSTSEISQMDVDTAPPRNVRYVGDLDTTDFATPKKAKRNLMLVKEAANKQRQALKTLRIQKCRLEARINSIKELLNHLQKKKKLSKEAANTILKHFNLKSK